ncbi:methyltransferase [Chloroflexota bacterium]
MNTLNANQLLLNILALLVAIPAVYLFYSVIRFFTIKRALGIDHFDLSYGKRSFVREGIFKITSNGMYIFGILIFWIPGLLSSSQAALLVALFNHIYIWVHYYTSERPDIRRIYGLSRSS